MSVFKNYRPIFTKFLEVVSPRTINYRMNFGLLPATCSMERVDQLLLLFTIFGSIICRFFSLFYVMLGMSQQYSVKSSMVSHFHLQQSTNVRPRKLPNVEHCFGLADTKVFYRFNCNYLKNISSAHFTSMRTSDHHEGSFPRV